MKNKDKRKPITSMDMQHLKDYLYKAGVLLAQFEHSYADKCFAGICFDMHDRVEKKLVGMIKASYKLKLKPYERDMLLYFRNEAKLAADIVDQDNAVVRLLFQNNG